MSDVTQTGGLFSKASSPARLAIALRRIAPYCLVAALCWTGRVGVAAPPATAGDENATDKEGRDIPENPLTLRGKGFSGMSRPSLSVAFSSPAVAGGAATPTRPVQHRAATRQYGAMRRNAMASRAGEEALENSPPVCVTSLMQARSGLRLNGSRTDRPDRTDRSDRRQVELNYTHLLT